MIVQVRSHKGLPPNRTVRLICCGKELFSEDLVSKALSKVRPAWWSAQPGGCCLVFRNMFHHHTAPQLMFLAGSTRHYP